jgi:hypothetical protein
VEGRCSLMRNADAKPTIPPPIMMMSCRIFRGELDEEN